MYIFAFEKGGSCFSSNNLAHCKCAYGFTGMWCQFSSKPKPNPSENNDESFQMGHLLKTVAPDSSFVVENKFSICSVFRCQNSIYLIFL